ncbi:MAG TPA: S9 family peptidase, partial [Allosphingosinicella sp.]
QDSEVYALDVDAGTFRTLTDRRGPDEQPIMSPDGRLIAYVGYEDKRLNYHNSRLTVMNADGSNPRVLTANLDRSVDSPMWAADGRSLFVSFEDKGRTKVARVGLDGTMRELTDDLSGAAFDRPYTGGSYSVARDGTLAITAGSSSRPADVALVRAGGEPRMLTRLNADLLGSKRLGEVRKIPVTAFDKRAIDAWLTLPPTWSEGQRVPLILEIHGGPVAAYGPHFSTDDQLYAASGYAVLSVNPRGSSSYGAEFAQLIHHDYPSSDYDDLMSAVDAAIAGGFVDPDKLFVTGGSGGGVLTSWIVGKTDRFKAAATQKPVINWTSEALTMDNTLFTSRYWFAKKPWEDPETYWKYSPLSLVGNVKTPTLVVVGSDDYRTPVSESEQYYAALQIQGVPTALVKVPGASHGGIAARPSQSAAKAAAILAWFERYKNGAPAAGTSATDGK